MSYYTDAMKAFNNIDDTIDKVMKSCEEIDINNFLLELTKIHPVSHKALKNRIIEYSKSRDFVIKNGKIRVK